MALVKIEIYRGKSAEYKGAILDGIHRALVKAFNMPADDINQRLYELPEDNFKRSAGRSKNFTIVEITAFQGRSRKAKKLLYAEIVKNLAANPGIAGSDVTVVLNEQPLHNWGIRGGKPADEVDLGFAIDV